MNLPNYIFEILKTINTAGYEAYVVGGCVRDYLLKRDIHDYDICTNAHPEIILSLFDHCIPTGLQHGTVTVVSESLVEITTFRVESEYKDHRHPNSVQYVKSIEEDLSRRDFTINAMAYHPDIGIIDPYGGKEDLEKRIIRCVGNPDARFNEDALRMLRAYRFCAKLKFKLEKETKQSILQNASDIQYVSIERIVHELKEIMENDPQIIDEMTLLLKPVIPELDEALHCQQHSIYHYTDVLHHTLDAMSYLKPYDETLSFALLFHDLGKMQVKTTDEKGFDHFYKHPKYSKEIAHRLCIQLKLTKEQRKWIPFYVEHHDDEFSCKLKTIYRYRIEYGISEDKLFNLMQIRYCDAMAHSEKGRESIQKIKHFYSFYQENKDRCMSLKDLCIDGKDVIENTDFRGKDINLALKKCLHLCFYDPKMNDRERLIRHLKNKSQKF